MRFSFEIPKEPLAEEGCLMSLGFTAQKISGSLYFLEAPPIGGMRVCVMGNTA